MLTIRRAAPADIPAMSDLYLEFHNFHARGVPARLQLLEWAGDDVPEILRKLLVNETAAVFVCCEGDQLIGLVEVYIKETDPHPAVVQRRYGYIQSLMVTESRRKLGLGARLVEAAEHWARLQGAAEVELEVWEFGAGPLGFYESLGYETEKRRLVRRV